MWYIYVLFSKKDRRFYTGFTNNLEKRFKDHKAGLVISTKFRLPFILVYYEVCSSREDAQAREKYLKSGMGKKYIRNRIKNHLKNL